MLTTNTLKGIAVVAALSIGALTFASPADAGKRSRRNLAAGAIIGLGAAAIIAGSRRRHYGYGYNYGYQPYYYAPPPVAYAPPPVAYYPPAPSYAYAPAPWSPAWYSYCSGKYRSFDPRDGTFQPYRGPRRLCQ